MRKMVFGRKLSRGKKAREALLKSLARAIISEGKIITTVAKAKAVKGRVEKLVSLAKKKTLASRRKAYADLGNDRKTVDKLFGTVAKTFLERTGGYTRVVFLPPRQGDKAKMVRLEWAEEIKKEEKPEKGKKDENIPAKSKRNK